MATDQPELFEGNPDVDLVVPKSFPFINLSKRLGLGVCRLEYPYRVEENDRSPAPTRHLLSHMCQSAEIRGEVALRPYLHLTPDERSRGLFAPRQIAIMSSGLNAKSPMRNKEWLPSRFQEVVDALSRDFTLLQVGSKDDPRLNGTIDLRGRTTIRQTAAVLSRSVVFIGLVGFLMHLARAVDCRSVIVFGGREAPWQSGYIANENLYTPIACAPCWLWNTCEYDRRCMTDIKHDAVVDAAFRQIARGQEPLEVERDVLPSIELPLVDGLR